MYGAGFSPCDNLLSIAFIFILTRLLKNQKHQAENRATETFGRRRPAHSLTISISGDYCSILQ